MSAGDGRPTPAGRTPVFAEWWIADRSSTMCVEHRVRSYGTEEIECPSRRRWSPQAPWPLVADGDPLPDLRPLVRRQQRRRRRGPARRHRAPRPSRVAGGRRHLAEPDHTVTQCRLGLRRGRLLRRAPRIRDSRRSGRAGGVGQSSGDPGSDRPGPEPHERSAPLVRRIAVVERCGPERFLRVGRPPTRWVAAQQLGGMFRRAGVDVGRHDGAVLPAQLPARTARPELVVSGCPDCVQRHSALLVGPGHRRLSNRRLQHDHQGRTTSRQPAGYGETTLSSCRCSGSVP